jgi:transcriptional regulator with XRE-family HTH domain
MRPDQIRELRKALGFSQEKLAQLLGVSWTTIHRWEKAGSTGPTGTALRTLNLLQRAVRDPHFQRALGDPRASDPMFVMHVLLQMFYGGKPYDRALSGGSRR